jgi:hypothetical protein
MTAEIVDFVEILAQRDECKFTKAQREAVIDAFGRAGIYDFYFEASDSRLPTWFEFCGVPDCHKMVLGKQGGEFYLFDITADRVVASGLDLGKVLDRIAGLGAAAAPDRGPEGARLRP